MDKSEKADAGYLSQSPEADTTLGQLFVKDRLTGMGGIRKNDSASKLSAMLGQPTGPAAKFDQQTGKFYKSFMIPASRFENVNVTSLLQLFSEPGLAYDHSTHSGAVVSLAAAGGNSGNIHVTLVGESHIEASALYDAAQVRVEVFLNSQQQQAPEEFSADFLGGMTLMSESAGSQDRVEAVVADQVAGVSLFANAGKVQDTMTMDSCAGLSLLSFAPEDLASEEGDSDECVASERSVDAVENAVSVAGLTLFNEQIGSERRIEELSAEHCSGISLYARTEKARDTMTADFVGGMTMLSYVEDDLSEGDTAAASEGDDELDEEEPLNDKDVVDLWNVMTNCAGLTLFGHKRVEEVARLETV